MKTDSRTWKGEGGSIYYIVRMQRQSWMMWTIENYCLQYKSLVRRVKENVKR